MLLAQLSLTQIVAFAIMFLSICCIGLAAAGVLWPQPQNTLSDKEKGAPDADPVTQLQLEIDEEIARENEGEDPRGLLQKILKGD